MRQEHPAALPLPQGYSDVEKYIRELLSFVSSSEILQTLVSRVHILDFYTATPNLYESIFDQDWRQWFALHDIDTLLHFFIREDLAQFQDEEKSPTWREESLPPESLVNYLQRLRSLTLSRTFQKQDVERPMPRQLAVGMKPKKIHEVENFARYIEALTKQLASDRSISITHLIDFGAGQGYLGRFLASQPYNKHIVAVEGRPHNVKAAQDFDVSANLLPKFKTKVNKKQYRAEQALARRDGKPCVPITSEGCEYGSKMPTRSRANSGTAGISIESTNGAQNIRGTGVVQHVQHRLGDGRLEDIVQDLTKQMKSPLETNAAKEIQGFEKTTAAGVVSRNIISPVQPSLFVMSLHSCGNLTHHALRSLILNPAVSAVAAVGCCYNLATERLGPPSYKSEYLRPGGFEGDQKDCTKGDPHGFPMSQRLCEYPTTSGQGITINITARMMAVQAPSNWTQAEAHDFFARHHFRALLQRVFLDQKVVQPPMPELRSQDKSGFVPARSPAGGGGSTQPLIVGSFNRNAYLDFVTYARTAFRKLVSTVQLKPDAANKLDALTDKQLQHYSASFEQRRKEIAVTWTLMALSATLIEATIVVDRWLWLREQAEVDECWVEPVFEYSKSPRNLVVVGVKKSLST